MESSESSEGSDQDSLDEILSEMSSQQNFFKRAERRGSFELGEQGPKKTLRKMKVKKMKT